MICSLAIPYAIGMAIIVIETIIFKQLPKSLRLVVGICALAVAVLFWVSMDTFSTTTVVTQ